MLREKLERARRGIQPKAVATVTETKNGHMSAGTIRFVSKHNALGIQRLS